MSSSEDVANAISGQSREVNTESPAAAATQLCQKSAAAAAGSDAEKRARDWEQQREDADQIHKQSAAAGTSHAAANDPLLPVHVAAVPLPVSDTSATLRQRLDLSQRHMLCFASLCIAVVVAALVIIGLLSAMVWLLGRSAASVTPVLQAASIAPTTTSSRSSSRPPTPSTPPIEAIQQPFDLELDTLKLPKCQAGEDHSALSACVSNTWVVLRGTSVLPIGPFTCVPGDNCRAVQPMEQHLQVVLPGTYRIRAQVTVKCSYNITATNQAVTLALFAADDEVQRNDNHQVCGPPGSLQTLHAAATVSLRPGDRVHLKLLRSGSGISPVEFRLLPLRASSQMSWEAVPSG